MYDEIFRALMCYRMTILLLLLGFAVFLFVILVKLPVEKESPTKKKKKQKKGKDYTPAAIIVVLVFVSAAIGINLHNWFALRKDMVTENYLTYTGEFYCYETTGKNRVEYVRWKNEEGETIEVQYIHHIDKYQEHEEKLKEGTYVGTIVYSPRGDALLWWDAEPIED